MSVIFEIKVGETSITYISLTWLAISRVDMPFAYIPIIELSSLDISVWCFFTIWGSKEPSRSLGMSKSNNPKSDLTVFLLFPLRELVVFLFA